MKFKVLDKLFFKGFIGPCFLAFFIVEFVLIMQNLWKVIDDILGKGYGILDYLELLSYFALAIIPMSLPLTVLLSSVMVYGDMAEKYELASAKSAGVSFVRLLKPGLIIAILVFFFSLIAANVLKPHANEGFHKKMRDMKTNKLTFVFDENIFNRDFKDISIRIGKKYEDGRSIEDILIYDHTDTDNSVLNMIRAKKGEMYTTPDQKFLIMDLKDGYHVKEVRAESADRLRKGFNAFARPMVRFSFSELRKVFNLTELMDLNVVNVSYRQYDMMNTLELISVIDSLDNSMDVTIQNNIHEFNLFAVNKEGYSYDPPIDTTAMPEFDGPPDQNKDNQKIAQSITEKQIKLRNRVSREKSKSTVASALVSIHPDRINKDTKSILEIIDFTKPDKVIDMVKKNTLGLQTNNSNNRQENRILKGTKARYTFKLHQMYSWATVCIIFLFIGAPAGAIVRKGGFGYPLLIAIGFYLTFVMSSIIGEKLMGSRAVSPVVGAWIPCILLFPFAIYLSWRALHDNRPIFRRIWQMIRKSRTSKIEIEPGLKIKKDN